MARKVYIDVIVDDKGTTKRLAVDAKKLEQSLGKVGKGSQEADRNLKGVAQISANATKNFSKMQQGISGGLVPAYATLAAQAFAVSAAFNSLQSAADFKNLTEGQAQFGAVTGVAYSRITKSLQEATDGQLKYAEAAQATAIGTAAGLSGEQLEGLATAAKNVSFALGRDLTDSFNRLIRGVTKAEPELLDELGIILRLDPATRQYAASIGKTKDELNAFERSQAVANFVLDEAETKFGKIGKIIDKDAFAVQQFAKSFDDLLNTVKTGVVSVLGPALSFLSGNITSLVAALTLFALPITKAIIPSLGNMSKVAKEAGEAAKRSLESAQDALVDSSNALKTYTQDQEAARKKADELARAGGVTPTTGEKKKSRLGMDFISGATDSSAARRNADRTLTAAEKQIDQFGKVTTGKLKGFNAQQVADLRRSYRIRSQIVEGFVKRSLLSLKGLQTGSAVIAAQTNLIWQKAFSGVVKLGSFAAGMLDKVFKGVGLIGIALLLFDIGKAAYQAFFPISDEAKRAKKEMDELNSRLEETAEHLGKTVELRADVGLLSVREKVIQLGNAIQEANIGRLIADVNKLSTLDPGSDQYEVQQQGLLKVSARLVELNPQYQSLHDAIKAGTPLTTAQSKALLEFSNSAIQGAKAGEQLSQAQKDVDNELNNLVNTIERAPLEGLVNSLQRQLDLQIQVGVKEGPQFQSDVKEFEDEIARLEKVRSGPLTTTITFDPKKQRNVKSFVNAQTEADKEAVEAKKQELEAAKEQERLRLKAIEDTKTLLAIAAKGQGEQLAIQAKISENKLKIAKIDKNSETFQARIARLAISELEAENKIEAAKQNVVSAETALSIAQKQSNGERDQAVINAERALELAKEGVETANEESRQIVEGNDLRERAIELEKLVLASRIQQLAITNRIALAQRNLNATQAGVSTLGLTQGQAAAQARGQELAAIDEKRQLAQERFRAIAVDISRLTGKEKEERLAGLQEQRDALANEIADLNLQERKLKLVKEIALNQLNLDTQALAQRRQSLSLNPIEEQFNQRILEYKNRGEKLTQEDIATIRERTEAQFFLNEAIEAQNSINQAVTSGLQKGLEGIITGTTSVKDAFASMATGILQELAKVLSQMLITRALLAAFPGFGGFSGGGIATPPTARYGGVMQGYATGGIARGRNAGYPAILHGTEAVVPLPNGNSIPVELRNGGAGGTNNVTVNVSVDQNGNAQSNTQMDNQQAGALGKAISAAVQEELQRQKRPGGMLSPYGAA